MSQVGWWGLWRSWAARPAWCAALATACPTSSGCRTKAWPAGPGPSLAGCPEGPLPSSNTSQKVGRRWVFSFVWVYVYTENIVEQLHIKTVTVVTRERRSFTPANEWTQRRTRQSANSHFKAPPWPLPSLSHFPAELNLLKITNIDFSVKARWRPSPTWRPVWRGTWTACLWMRSTTPGRRSGGGSCRRASGTGWGRACRGSASACWVSTAAHGFTVNVGTRLSSSQPFRSLLLRFKNNLSSSWLLFIYFVFEAMEEYLSSTL